MSAFEQLTMGSAALPPQGSVAYGIRNANNGYMILNQGVTNFLNLLPGTSDFCWEMWCRIGNLNGQLIGFGNLPSSQFECHFQDNGGGTFQLPFNVKGNLPATSNNFTTSQYIGQGWIHVAFARSGSTVSTWLNGELASRLTGFTDTLDSSVASTIWIMGGPVGDRDETYAYGTDGSWRNMRYVIGDSVYGTATSFQPPSVDVDIPVITGTQYIWWLDADSSVPTYSDFGGGPYAPDYSADANWLFNTGFGASNGTVPYRMPYLFPGGDPAYPDGGNGSTVFTKGSFANMGTAPNQPIITNTGPAVPGFWTSTVGDFTATGTNVRIYNADANTFSPGSNGFVYILYFYVPGNITDECKNLIVTEAANGLVLNIGRTGYGLDWLSFETYEGTELAYGPHVWARNAWNYLVVQRNPDQFSVRPPAQTCAWGGWAGQSMVPRIPLTDSGLTTYAFAGGVQPFSIGCKAGSSVSCQMYLSEIWTWITNFQFFYDFNADYISQQTVAPFANYSDSALAMIFDGANGSTTFTQL